MPVVTQAQIDATSGILPNLQSGHDATKVLVEDNKKREQRLETMMRATKQMLAQRGLLGKVAATVSADGEVNAREYLTMDETKNATDTFFNPGAGKDFSYKGSGVNTKTREITTDASQKVIDAYDAAVKKSDAANLLNNAHKTALTQAQIAAIAKPLAVGKQSSGTSTNIGMDISFDETHNGGSISLTPGFEKTTITDTDFHSEINKNLNDLAAMAQWQETVNQTFLGPNAHNMYRDQFDARKAEIEKANEWASKQGVVTEMTGGGGSMTSGSDGFRAEVKQSAGASKQQPPPTTSGGGGPQLQKRVVKLSLRSSRSSGPTDVLLNEITARIINGSAIAPDPDYLREFYQNVGKGQNNYSNMLPRIREIAETYLGAKKADLDASFRDGAFTSKTGIMMVASEHNKSLTSRNSVPTNDSLKAGKTLLAISTETGISYFVSVKEYLDLMDPQIKQAITLNKAGMTLKDYNDMDDVAKVAHLAANYPSFALGADMSSKIKQKSREAYSGGIVGQASSQKNTVSLNMDDLHAADTSILGALNGADEFMANVPSIFKR